MNLTLRVKSAPTIKLRYVPGLKGDKGDTGTIAVGTTTTGAPGTDAAVTNTGTPTSAVFNFTIPRGDEGQTGDAATITVGSVAASAPGSMPTITNVGTSGAAVFNFVLPRGDPGPAVGPGSIGTPELADSAVTLAKMQQIASARFLGRVTGGDGLIELLTKAQLQGALDITTALVALGTLTTAADKLPYATGLNTFAMADFSSFARTLLDDANATTARATLAVPFELISTVTVSGSPGTIDFTSFPAGYGKFMLDIDGILPTTDDAYLMFRLQTGGSTWQASGYIYSGRMQGPGAGADMSSSIDGVTGNIPLARPAASNGVSSAAGLGLSGDVIFNPNDTSARRRVLARTAYARPDVNELAVTVAGAYGSPNAATGVRLLWSAGSFANQGKVKLYGARS